MFIAIYAHLMPDSLGSGKDPLRIPKSKFSVLHSGRDDTSRTVGVGITPGDTVKPLGLISSVYFKFSVSNWEQNMRSLENALRSFWRNIPSRK